MFSLYSHGILGVVFTENARDEGGESKFELLDTPRGQGGGRGAEGADAASLVERCRSAEAADVVSVAETAKSEKVIDANHAWRIERTHPHKKDGRPPHKDKGGDPGGSRNIGGVCAVSQTDVVGIVDNLAKKACDQEGRRKFVFIKTKGIWWQM